MAKKGKNGKKGKKGKAKDEAPPSPHGTIPWRVDGGAPLQDLRMPARAGNFLLFQHRHTPPPAQSLANVAPIGRSRGGGGSGPAAAARPETVHLLCIANTETGLHIALPLPPSHASRAAASRRAFFVRTPGSDWWVSNDNTPVTVEPPSASRSGGSGLPGPPVLVSWDERGATPAQGALRSMPLAPHGADPTEDDDGTSIPPGVAAALPTKQASRAAHSSAAGAASLDAGWYLPMAGEPGTIDGESTWALCWLGGASGMLEICLRDPSDDAAWRLTLSSQGGVALCQGSRS
jgi:hypothetical protein